MDNLIQIRDEIIEGLKSFMDDQSQIVIPSNIPFKKKENID